MISTQVKKRKADAAIAARLGADAAFRDAARRRICERKHHLFDDDAAVGEWASFLERAVGELVD